jgi:16S rRNA (guanine527-N7)-methyltransferase
MWIMSQFTEVLESHLALLGLPYEPSLPGKCEMYYLQVMEANRHLNLTRITGEAEAAVQHFADAMALVSWLKLPSGCSVLDIGTGAGFPGVPLKLLKPDIHLTLMDASGKKMDFVRQTLKDMNVDADVLCTRAEEAARTSLREHFDIVVSRAVAALPMLLELSVPLLKTGGTLATWKGETADEELAVASNALKTLGCVVTERRSIGRGALLLFEKQTPTPEGYPRRFSKIKSQPL